MMMQGFETDKEKAVETPLTKAMMQGNGAPTETPLMKAHQDLGNALDDLDRTLALLTKRLSDVTRKSSNGEVGDSYDPAEKISHSAVVEEVLSKTRWVNRLTVDVKRLIDNLDV